MQRLAPLNATVGPTYFVALRIALAAAAGTTIQPRLPTRSTASVSRITTPALTGPPRLYVCRPNAPARSLSCRQPLPRRRSPEPDSPPQSVHPHADRPDAAPTDRVVGLSPLQIQRRFTAAARAAGIEARLTAHSGRVGLASELTARGASTTEVMLAGNWKTARMVAHYSAGATAERGAVAKYL